VRLLSLQPSGYATMTRYDEVELTRECTVVQIPQGNTVTLEAETLVVITQALGDSYTIQVPTLGGMYRVSGEDADALGKTCPHAAHAAAAALISAGQPITRELAREILKDVYDPEIPVNIVDLGLVYDLRLTPHATGGSQVHVTMTLTAPGCGMGQIIAADVKHRLEDVPGITEADVEIVWDPPWEPQRISSAGRAKLGME
jgi:probable FeS assembly SUF system protein SufT